MKRKTYKLLIPIFALLPAKYYITVYSKRKNSIKTGPITALENGSKQCWIEILNLSPWVQIDGGAYQWVNPNKDVWVNGKNTHSRISLNGTYESFLFKWTCQQKLKPPTFCKNFVSEQYEFKIPAKYVQLNEEFTIFLKVRELGLSNVQYGTTKQIIYVKPNIVELKIAKNCMFQDYMATDKKTVFEVVCLYNCEGNQETEYRWSMGSPKKYVPKMRARGFRYVIPENTLSNIPYSIQVHYNGSKKMEGRSSYGISFHSHNPERNKCDFVPNEGTTLETLFSLTCTVEDTYIANNFEVYFQETINGTVEETLIISGIYPEILHAKYLLPESSGREFVVKIIEPTVSDMIIKVPVTVRSSIQEGKDVNDTINNFKKALNLGSLTQMISDDSAERQQAFANLKNVLDELANLNNNDTDLINFKRDLQFSVTETLLKARTNTFDEMLQVSNIVGKLQMIDPTAKTDPLLAKQATTLCKKIADKSLSLMKKNALNKKEQKKAKQISQSVAECMEVQTTPNPEIIKPVDIGNVTTPEPNIKVPVLTENYANYVDYDEQFFKDVENLEEASYNMVNASAVSAKTTALATEVGEGTVEIKSKKTETVIFKDLGFNLYKFEVRMRGLTIRTSVDFKNDSHPYDLLVTSWWIDIFWWNPAKIRVVTNIINLEYWHSTCKERVSNLKEPTNVFLDVKKHKRIDTKLQKYSWNAQDFFENSSEDDLNYKIRVHRFVLVYGMTLQIYFQNLTANDSLQAVMLMNEYPTMEHFNNENVTSLATNQKLMFINEQNFNVLVYLGIVLKNETNGTAIADDEIDYSFSSVAVTCLKWTTGSKEWTIGCATGYESNRSTIHCRCNNFSIISGYVNNIESPLQTVIKADLEMTISVCYIIFGTVLGTLAVFFLLLMVTCRQKELPVYFLGDNLASDLYGYLIYIRTGEGLSSGTTSNVVIKITGDKGASEPHVLNYPDPKLKMLQVVGNDLFVVATEQHLGDLQFIELWFDSIGQNPSWFCREITIYDMQLQTDYYFPIKSRLSVLKNRSYLVVRVGGSTYKSLDEANKMKSGRFRKLYQMKDWFKRNFKHVLNLSTKYHSWAYWHLEPNFSGFKRVSVNFSNIFTIYAVCLILVGVPRMEIKDGFDVRESLYNYYSTVCYISAVIASFPICLLHIALACSFRFSAPEITKYKGNARYPFTCTLICWAIITSLIVASVSFLVIYGFWVPPNKSFIWLKSSLIALIVGVVIYENLFYLIHERILNWRITANIIEKLGDILKSVEAQRLRLYSVFGHDLLRPYFEDHYEPLGRYTIRKKKKFETSRFRAINDFSDLIMFGIYVLILYMVILFNKDEDIVLGQKQMEKLVTGDFLRSMNFDDIQEHLDVYQYIEKTLIPSIQPMYWYDNYVVAEPGTMIDMVNKYIGIVRIRQQRIKDGICKIPNYMNFLNMSCWPEFKPYYSETRTFGEHWDRVESYQAQDRLAEIWHYMSASQIKTPHFRGRITTYTGGGYVGYLGRTLYNSLLNFHAFTNKSWLDDRSRVVFIEFLTYNTDHNYFNSIRLVFEESATSYINKKAQVYTVRMLFNNSDVEAVSLMVFGIFVFWVSMLFLKQSLGIIKNIRSFYKDVWTILDLIIIFLSVVCIVLSIMRMGFVKDYLAEMEAAKHNDFLSYFSLFFIEDIVNFIAAFLVCFATIRLWRFLRFGLMFRIFEKTLVVEFQSLVSVLLIYVFFAGLCAATIVLSVGGHLSHTDNVSNTARILLTIALKPTEIQFKRFLDYKFALFFITIYGVSLKVFINLIISVIVSAYRGAQIFYSSDIETYTIKNYVFEQWKYLPKFFRYKYGRLKAGQSLQRKVEPKADKFLYQNSSSIFSNRINLMVYTAKCIIRRKVQRRQLSDEDFKLMFLIAETLFRKNVGEVDVFYYGRIKGARMRYIDEQKIEQVAIAANLLLQDKEYSVERERNVHLEECSKAIRDNLFTLHECTRRLTVVSHKMDSVEFIARDLDLL